MWWCCCCCCCRLWLHSDIKYMYIYLMSLLLLLCCDVPPFFIFFSFFLYRTVMCMMDFTWLINRFFTHDIIKRFDWYVLLLHFDIGFIDFPSTCLVWQCVNIKYNMFNSYLFYFSFLLYLLLSLFFSCFLSFFFV